MDIHDKLKVLRQTDTGRFSFYAVARTIDIAHKPPLSCGLTSRCLSKQQRQTRKGRFIMDAKERFYTHVKKTETCWLWVGAKNWGGYGHVKVNGIMVSAHRRSYEMEFGSIPTGFHVLHKCDNPSCVNPEHLYLGTHRDNMKDRAEKKRSYIGLGRGYKKLSPSQVNQIKKSNLSQHELARIYNVDNATIRAALGLRKP